MKNECHIYRQSIVHARQTQDKTNTKRVWQSRLGQDKSRQGKTITDCLPSFNQVRKTIRREGMTISLSERQTLQTARQLEIVLHTSLHSARQDNWIVLQKVRLSARQDNRIVLLPHKSFGKTIQLNCLAHHWNTRQDKTTGLSCTLISFQVGSSARQSQIVLLGCFGDKKVII